MEKGLRTIRESNRTKYNSIMKTNEQKFDDIFKIVGDAIQGGLNLSEAITKRRDLINEIEEEGYLYNLPNKDLEDMIKTGRAIKKQEDVNKL